MLTMAAPLHEVEEACLAGEEDVFPRLRHGAISG